MAVRTIRNLRKFPKGTEVSIYELTDHAPNPRPRITAEGDEEIKRLGKAKHTVKIGADGNGKLTGFKERDGRWYIAVGKVGNEYRYIYFLGV